MHRLYRLALLAYPPDFRSRFARDMLEHFVDRLARDARGPLHRALLAGALIARTAAAGATERCRPARHRNLMPHALTQDIRHGLRALLRRPVFTAVALVTLALGIGANTAIFSVVHAALLRDLPFPAPDRIVRIYETHRLSGFSRGVANPLVYDRWERGTTTLASMSAMRALSLTLTGAGEPARVRAQAVTPEFFDVMRVRPEHGRRFTAGETAADHRVAILSNALWRFRFGAETAAIGRGLTLEGDTYEVVGVMPAGFGFPSDTDVWVPLAVTATERTNLTSYYLGVIGRLKPDATIEAAQAEFDTIAAGLEREFPRQRAGRGAAVVGLQEAVVGPLSGGLKLLQGVVLAVLLIACANVANLLLAQGVARSRELAVRTAMGASRWRLVRQLLTESLMLATAGAALGAVLAVWGVKALLALSPQSLPEGISAGVAGWPLLFTAAMAVATAVGFGVVPAFFAVRADAAETLRDGGRGGTARRGAWLRGGLIAAEVTLALVLLTGAGLLIRSFAKLASQDVGFEREGIVTAFIGLPEARYGEPDARARFWDTLFERLEQLPGVTAATGSTALPFSNWQWQTRVLVEGQDEPARGAAGIRAVTPEYFSTLGVPLLAGREFTARDVRGSERVVVVNQTFARGFLRQDAPPIGQRVATTFRPTRGSASRGVTTTTASDIEWATVIGIVGDTRHQDLGEPPDPEMYQPLRQQPPAMLMLALKTRGDTAALAAGLAPVVGQVDASIPVEKIATMQSLVAGTVAPRRFHMLLLAFFAALALVLAACGIYGVTEFSVSQRVREMAIRLALGAEPGRVVRLVVRQGLKPVALGLAAGVPLAMSAARLIQSQLFLTSSRDTVTMILVVGLLGGAAALACWLPARRTGRVAPIEVLRTE